MGSASGFSYVRAHDDWALHENVDGELSGMTQKVSPASADHLLIEDSADGNAKKRVLWSALPGAGGGETNTASNSGSGTSVYYQKTGVDIELNGIKSENNIIGVALDAASHDIELTAVEANLVHDHDGITGGATVEGTSIGSTGEAGGTKYLREDGDGTCSWQTPAGSGDVSKVGTPVDNQVGVWTGDGTIEGTAGLAYDGSTLALTGAMTVTSTVDGRDVATDGSKLDGIEALADVTDVTNVSGAGALMDSEVDADIKTLALPANTTISAFGATLVDDANAAASRTTLGLVIGTDVQAHAAVLDNTTASYTTAEETKLSGIETAADVTDTTNVTAAGALMDSEVDADIKTLVLPASTTISTFGASLVDDTTATAARTTLGMFKSKSITVEDPADGDRLALFMNNGAITVTGISHASLAGTSVLYNLEFAASIASGTVIHTDTCASSTPEWDVAPSGDDTVPTDQIILLEITTVTGTVTDFTLTFYYTED